MILRALSSVKLPPFIQDLRPYHETSRPYFDSLQHAQQRMLATRQKNPGLVLKEAVCYFLFLMNALNVKRRLLILEPLQIIQFSQVILGQSCGAMHCFMGLTWL